MRIHLIAAARPNFMKVAPLYPDFDSCGAHGGVPLLLSVMQNKQLRVREVGCRRNLLDTWSYGIELLEVR